LEHTHPAWLRVKFDELLAQQLSLAAAREARRAKKAPILAAKPGQASLCARLVKILGFDLTEAQRRVISEISADLARAYPMHRLLQGDVGSGKTVVAAMAAMQAIDAGMQVAVMAPTEILAEQHFQKMRVWCEALGIELRWLTGSMPARARRSAVEAIASGQARLIIGTQALIQESVRFCDLGLVIVDEQHRFGVAQRLDLTRKGEADAVGAGDPELVPHQLTMSATPIPRTLAMTFFADLEVSSIDGLPPGRKPVTTKLVSSERRAEIIGHVMRAAEAGTQTYWVCPLIEESEALDLQTAVDTHAALALAMPGLVVGLVHGRMPTAEKAGVMRAFRDGEISVLVATTVIEVGVDVPNAALMVVEHAERFGLAQLHQLRGRVGRGQAQSVCVLMFQAPLSMLARERLRAMYETQDGFEIAQRDLDLRGPGELLGSRQSGMALLKFADLAQDGALVRAAREVAIELRRDEPAIVARHLARWMRGREDFLRS
jgi:ATP-dependent DNA helicase RecG